MCVPCSGEANGTAYVQFESAAMAKDAFARYNDVALDGKPMKIAFDNGSARVLSSGIRYESGCLCLWYQPLTPNYLITTSANAAFSLMRVVLMQYRLVLCNQLFQF